MSSPILEIKNLSVLFHSDSNDQPAAAIKNISFTLNPEETLGIIGESGSGKSVTLLSLLGLIDAEPGVVSGSIKYHSKSRSLNLLQDIEQYITVDSNDVKVKNKGKWKKHRENLFKKVRGKEISMIFQNPKLAFNPFYSIGSQINEMIRLHTDVKDKKEAKEVAIKWLDRVKMEAPAMRYNNNPYGLSGGMCQRAMIAMSLASEPSILIADEPTTGLDATIQANIVDLLMQIKSETGISMIVVSHDFNVMRQLADRIIVYYKGRIIEEGNTDTIFDVNRKEMHPYTRRLLETNLDGYIDSSFAPPFEESNNNGCDFCDLCPSKENAFIANCENQTPELFNIAENHAIRCWRFQHVG